MPEPDGPQPTVATFSQINVVVADMDATIAFYRSLGLDVPDAPEWPAGSGRRHTEVGRGPGPHLAFDNTEMARSWDAGLDDIRPGNTVVIGIALADRGEVDACFQRAADAGVRAAQAPCDAFWGARYAVVVDPDGHHVGLMSPIDESRRFDPALER
ncbi:MAG: VOC family protein [Jiangellaceae bacterium]